MELFTAPVSAILWDAQKPGRFAMALGDDRPVRVWNRCMEWVHGMGGRRG